MLLLKSNPTYFNLFTLIFYEEMWHSGTYCIIFSPLLQNSFPHTIVSTIPRIFSAVSTTLLLNALTLYSTNMWTCMLAFARFQLPGWRYVWTTGKFIYLTPLYYAFLSNAKFHKNVAIGLWQLFCVFLTRMNAPYARQIACWSSGYNRSKVAQQAAVFSTIRLFYLFSVGPGG
jgi:hypothetical protein